MKRRHEALMCEYLIQRRDELVGIWEECRDAYPYHKLEIDRMFAQLIGELQQAIDSWSSYDIIE